MYLIAFLLLLLGWAALITRNMLKTDYYNILITISIVSFITAPILAIIEKLN